MKTGYCATNGGDMYISAECGPIRATVEEAQKDCRAGDYTSVRYLALDGYFYVDPPADDDED